MLLCGLPSSAQCTPAAVQYIGQRQSLAGEVGGSAGGQAFAFSCARPLQKLVVVGLDALSNGHHP